MRLAAAREERALWCAQGGSAEVMPCLPGYRDVERRCRDQETREEQGRADRAGVSPAPSRGEQSQQDPGSSPGLRGFAGLGGRVGTAQCCSWTPFGIQLQAKVGSHPAFPRALLLTLSSPQPVGTVGDKKSNRSWGCVQVGKEGWPQMLRSPSSLLSLSLSREPWDNKTHPGLGEPPQGPCSPGG